jgi:DUF3047 family protein
MRPAFDPEARGGENLSYLDGFWYFRGEVGRGVAPPPEPVKGQAMTRSSRALAAAALVLLLSSPARPDDPALSPRSVTVLDVHRFRPAEGPSSGPAVYYEVVEDPVGPILRSSYRPGMETVTMGIEVPEALRKRVRLLRWRWRVRAFPTGGDECRGGYGDSPASVAAAFKRGFKWYILRFVWSTASPLGAVCDKKRNLFLARDTIVLERGGAAGVWLNEVVDVHQSFLNHFVGGDPNADVPDLVGIAVLSDGDQTRSESGADFAGFELEY